MPHARVGRTVVWMRPLWGRSLQLSFLRQPALPQVPWPADRSLAGATTLPALALRLLPVDLHTACGVAPTGSSPAEGALRIVAQVCGRQPAKTLSRSSMVGSPAQCVRSSAHLDSRPGLSPARPLAGQRGRTVGRRPALAGTPKSPIPGARPRTLHHLPGPDARCAQSQRAADHRAAL